MICPYCGKSAEWCENKEIYGQNYGKSYMVYLCKPCQAWVGCHQNGKNPLGTMANKELREWRQKAHRHIDPLWKEGWISRGKLYKMLRMTFNREIHVGSADIDTCRQILNIDLNKLKYATDI